jgi:hypothetical protein
MLGYPGELAGVHRLGRLQQAGLGLPDGGDSHVLGGAGQDRHVLVANITASEGCFGLG